VPSDDFGDSAELIPRSTHGVPVGILAVKSEEDVGGIKSPVAAGVLRHGEKDFGFQVFGIIGYPGGEDGKGVPISDPIFIDVRAKNM